MGPLKAADGSYIDTRGKLVGYAYGDSLPDKIANEGIFVADYLTEDQRHELQPGDLVVVDAPASASPIKKRLRIVSELQDNVVSFKADRWGKPHRPRPLKEVVAKVEWAEQKC